MCCVSRVLCVSLCAMHAVVLRCVCVCVCLGVVLSVVSRDTTLITVRSEKKKKKPDIVQDQDSLLL